MPSILKSTLVPFCLAVALHGEVRTLVDKPTLNRIRPVILLLPPEWASQIPPIGRVNAPEFLDTLYPGQRIALGLFAEGPDRDSLLNDIGLGVRITVGSGVAGEWTNLTPVAIRHIKAEGADFALMALGAGGISDTDRDKIEQASSLVTLAVFSPEWAVPAVAEVSDVLIEVNVSASATQIDIPPQRLAIKRTEEWLTETPPTLEELGTTMNRHRGDLAPGELLSWLSVAAKGGSLHAAPVHSFFAMAFKANASARNAAVDLFATLDPDIQPALLWVLRLGGHDLKRLFPDLPDKTLDRFLAERPLEDPRSMPHFQDPVDANAVGGIGETMDQCWGAWMATGDQSYLRALVDLLEGAPDFAAFDEWKTTRGGVKGLNARVARGLAYQIAGWSISSFQRTDPRVADWLQHWQVDPGVSATIRQELAKLQTNPAFERK